MSKVDAQRAMREAKYAAMMAQASPAPAEAAPAQRIRPRDQDSESRSETDGEPVANGAVEAQSLCGHRSIGNKSCQRPAGHVEKNHRYH